VERRPPQISGSGTDAGGSGNGGTRPAMAARLTAAAPSIPDHGIVTRSTPTAFPAASRPCPLLTRNTCSDNTATGNALCAARDWIANQFTAIGGLTISESFNYTACGTGSTTVTDHNSR
jgi:hypothetical protein